MYTPNGTSFVESLSINQSFVSETVYRTQSGLFLDEGQDSEVQVFVPGREDGHRGGSMTQPPEACSSRSTTCTSKPTLASSCAQFSFTKTDEIKSFFSCVRNDPALIYIGQHNSRSRLNVTRDCFEQLLKTLAVFPVFKDHILHFGYRQTELEIAPPYPHVSLLSTREDASRKLCGFEVCYGLRYAVHNERLQGKTWSLRQFVVYNKTLSSQQNSQWIFLGLPWTIRHQVEILARHNQGSKTPFDIHFLLLMTVIKMWRPYFIHLTEKLAIYTKDIQVTGTSKGSQLRRIDESTLVSLKSLEDQALDAVLAIQATMKTVSKLASLIKNMNEGQNRAACLNYDSSLPLDQTIHDQCEELEMLLNQGKTLLDKTKGIANTVSNFLNLAAKNEAIEMSNMAKIAGSDTKAVKALSVIALTYLPVNVVLGFFSTGFVEKVNGRIQVLEQWWLVLAISCPLIFAILLSWTLWEYRHILGRYLVG